MTRNRLTRRAQSAMRTAGTNNAMRAATLPTTSGNASTSYSTISGTQANQTSATTNIGRRGLVRCTPSGRRNGTMRTLKSAAVVVVGSSSVIPSSQPSILIL